MSKSFTSFSGEFSIFSHSFRDHKKKKNDEIFKFTKLFKFMKYFTELFTCDLSFQVDVEYIALGLISVQKNSYTSSYLNCLQYVNQCCPKNWCSYKRSIYSTYDFFYSVNIILPNMTLLKMKITCTSEEHISFSVFWHHIWLHENEEHSSNEDDFSPEIVFNFLFQTEIWNNLHSYILKYFFWIIFHILFQVKENFKPTKLSNVFIL